MADMSSTELPMMYDSELNNLFVKKAELQGVTTLDHTQFVPPAKDKSYVERVLNTPLIDTLIIINVVQMGVAVDLHGSPWDSIWMVFDSFVAASFFIEMVMRIYLLRRNYWKRWLNIIDFAIVWLGLIDVLLVHYLDLGMQDSMSTVQLLRLVRLLRFTRLLRVFPSVAPMIESMAASLKAMSLLFALVCFVIYVAAIPCVTLIGNRSAGYPGYDDNSHTLREAEVANFNNYRFFGTMLRSMITLFHLSMLSDEMVEVIRATSEIQKWPVFFFIGFVLLMTLCLLNTILGVIVEKTVSSVLHGDANKDALQRQKKMEALEHLSELIQQFDGDGNGEISLEELKIAIQDHRLQALLQQISLPVGFTVEELFGVLDSDGNGSISHHEFTGGLFRIFYSNDFQREWLMRLEQTHIKTCVVRMKDQVIAEMRSDHEKMMQEIQALRSFVYNVAGTGHAHDALAPAAAKGLSSPTSAGGCPFTGSRNEDFVVQGHQQIATHSFGQTVPDELHAHEVPDAIRGARIRVDASNSPLSAQMAGSQSRSDSMIHGCARTCAVPSLTTHMGSNCDESSQIDVPDALRGALLAVESSNALLVAQMVSAQATAHACELPNPMCTCSEQGKFITHGHRMPCVLAGHEQAKMPDDSGDEHPSMFQTAGTSNVRRWSSRLSENPKLIL